MVYYQIKSAVNTPETGSAYPQVQKMSPGYNYDAPNSVHALSREVTNLPDYEPNFNSLILHGKAKPSDLLSVTVLHNGFLVSEKFKNVLEQFNLPTHKFYSAPVLSKKQTLNYYWLHIICDLTDQIDYSKSTFAVYNIMLYVGPIEIPSKEEFEQKFKKLKLNNPGKTIFIRSEKLAFKESFKNPFDLFWIGRFDSADYISENLKNAIIKEKITGCSINPADNLNW